MTTLNCDQIEELAGAFALDALPADESAAVLAHLASCPDAHELIGELVEVAGLLPFLVDEVEPPTSLRSNLIAAALASEDAPASPAMSNPAAGSVRQGMLQAVPGRDAGAAPSRRSNRSRWLSPALMAAAALLVVAVGLGIWNVGLQRRLDSRSTPRDQQAVLTALASGAQVTPLTSENGIQAQLVRPAGNGTAYVVGTMPAPPPGKAYQAWLIHDGRPVGAGVFKSSGFAIMPIRGDLNGAQLLAFTLEPEQGSNAPTQPIVAQVAIG